MIRHGKINKRIERPILRWPWNREMLELACSKIVCPLWSGLAACNEDMRIYGLNKRRDYISTNQMELRLGGSKAGLGALSSSLLCHSYEDLSCHASGWWPKQNPRQQDGRRLEGQKACILFLLHFLRNHHRTFPLISLWPITVSFCFIKLQGMWYN